LCGECLATYESEIDDAVQSASCERCGGSIPRGEFEIFYESGQCGWCEHMTSKIEAGDEPIWSPEKNLEAKSTRIITAVDFLSNKITPITDPRLIRYLAEHPSEVMSMSPREFEEFIAELLKRMGYRTRVGPRGADGGVDVFAEIEGDVGPELVLVQCKRFELSRKVSQPVVKQLLADVHDRRASRGLVVTTSSFSRPALDYIEERKYILSGADFDKLQAWLRKLKGVV